MSSRTRRESRGEGSDRSEGPSRHSSSIGQLTRRVLSTAAFRRIRAIAAHPVQGTLLLVLLGLVGMAATAFLAGVPAPGMHDEFAYLLAGDTFASGRLTNPTPAHWQHFETFHVLLEPTYQAKYPPAQGLFLALGMIVIHPIVGVWISVLLMIVATVWALRAVLQAEWAFYASLLLLLEMGVASYWAQSYWGGAVAAGGGALVYGAAGRIATGGRRVGAAGLGGVGLAVLANSRPAEGLLLALACGVWVIWATARRTESLRDLWRPFAIATAIGLLGVTFAGIYNRAVTGDVTEFPYVLHTTRYGHSPSFFMLPDTSPTETMHPDIDRLNEVWDLQRARAREQGIQGIALRLFALVRGTAGPAFVLLFAVPIAWRRRGTRPTLLVLGPVFFLVLLTTAARQHFLAAGIAPLFGLIGLVAAEVGKRIERPLGPPLLAALLLLSVMDVGFRYEDLLDRNDSWASRRQELLTELRETPGRDLIFVHYPDEHIVHRDWVYNRADIPGSEVIWARPIDSESDASLVAAYGDRRVWDLTVDETSEPIDLAERDGPDQRFP